MSLSKGRIHSSFRWLTDEQLSFEVRHECSKLDEHELIRRARRYDADALAAIHSRYSRPIYNHIYRWTGDRSLAEDLTAEVFMQLLGTIDVVDSETSLRVLLYRTAGNLVIEHQRRQSAQLDARSGNIQRPELRQAVRRLPPDQQQVLVLKLVEEMPNDEIAQIIDRTEDAVKALQHHALVALRWLMRN
jgi:RNA polymerase sigma-70 factor (ECF subfamily)